MFRSDFDNKFRKKANSKNTEIAQLLSSCFQNNWQISKDDYNALAEKINYVAQYGNEEQKKSCCRMLYEARIQTENDTHNAGIYLELEFYFRKLCSPDFDLESSFIDSPLNSFFDLSSNLSPKL